MVFCLESDLFFQIRSKPKCWSLRSHRKILLLGTCSRKIGSVSVAYQCRNGGLFPSNFQKRRICSVLFALFNHLNRIFELFLAAKESASYRLASWITPLFHKLLFPFGVESVGRIGHKIFLQKLFDALIVIQLMHWAQFGNNGGEVALQLMLLVVATTKLELILKFFRPQISQFAIVHIFSFVSVKSFVGYKICIICWKVDRFWTERIFKSG